MKSSQLPSEAPLEPPFVHVEGVPNFRDLGGLPCVHGQTDLDKTSTKRCIRHRYLFRSAQPTQITAEGLATLTSDLNVAHIYDLRSSKELRMVRARFPDKPLDIPSVTRHHVPVYNEEDYAPISTQGLSESETLSDIAPAQNQLSQAMYSHDVLVSAYEDILRHAAKGGCFRAIMLHILNRPDQPVQYHCMLGKDRTGVFTALILKLCGVDDEDVIEDYALTTIGMGKWREYLVERMMSGAAGEYTSQSKPGTQKRPPTREEAEKIVTSHPEDMQAFLKLLEDKFGGARHYFKEHNGFKDEELDKIIQNLVVTQTLEKKTTSK